MSVLEHFDLDPDPAGACPCPDVVRLAEYLLVEARAGNIRALAYAAVLQPNGPQRVATAWAAPGATLFGLGSAVMVLSHRVARMLAP